MKSLYDKTCAECSKLITRRYSTSFSLGILMLGKSVRQDVYSIYGFVRLADEIVDTFQENNPRYQLRLLAEETFRAIDNGLSFNPVLHAFQEVVNRHKIERSYIQAFLDSMAMDLAPVEYNRALYEKYIYGSAEVVGLMCLKVFCDGDQLLFDQLQDPARKLGSAFQKVNFLRDLRSDLEDRKRVYFPGLDITRFSDREKSQIEQEIDVEFKEALLGINRLPANCRLGVKLAYQYYLDLFRKIRRSKPEQLLAARIRVSNFRKVGLLIHNLLFPNTYVVQNG